MTTTASRTVVTGRARAERALERIAIVNRGEAAMRLIRAVREMNEEGGLGLRTVALYTDPDRQSLFVREADEAVRIGPALVAGSGGARHSAYVDLELLESALRDACADAAWVGWGFVAEQPSFAELCRRLGVVFIGPSPEAMRLLGDKIAAKRLAERCGVPVGAWSGGPVDTVEAALEHAERIGYPLMLKAAGGGGGRGIRTVHSAGEVAEALVRARAEAVAGFGDSTIFMERMVPVARHVEVQVVGDGAGTTWTLGVRDCSVQRRHQKVVEESASTALDPAAEARLREASARLCNEAGYRGAGTVEFLVDPAGTAVFMEVNARLQVEHPVTEITTGVDIVKLQLYLARGGELVGEPPPPWGHAIEVRLCAEDPDAGFTPAPGRVELLRLPSGPGIRVDSGVAEGDAVASEFDSMIAKIIAWGRDRDEALGRLRRAVAETAVVVRGGTTNRAFLLDLLGRPELRDGVADAGWLDRVGARPAARPHADVALLLAAVEVDESELAIERARFLSSAARGRPQVPARIGRVVELRSGGQAYRVRLDRRGRREWSVELDGHRAEVEVEHVGRFERRVRCLGGVHRALCVEQGADLLVEVGGAAHRVSRDDGGMVRSPSPAVVVALRATAGEHVDEGDALVVLEAMKMEIPVCAPFSGTVSRVLVTENVQVDTGAPLVQVTATSRGDTAPAPASERITLPETVDTGGDPRAGRRALGLLRRLTLGYDVDASAVASALREHAQAPRDDADLRRDEEAVLSAFADVCSLSRRRPEEDEEPLHATAGSPQEQLFAHLRSLDAEPEPPAFAEALRCAVAHYGVTSLERSPELEDALFLIVRAHQRPEAQVPAVLSLLDRRLEGPPPAGADDRWRQLLDRIHVAARRRHPAVADLAREVRHRHFDHPLMERARQAVYAEMEQRLARLGEDPGAEERSAIVDALVQCAQPLHNLLSSRFAAAPPAVRGTLLEVMTRRYYRSHALREVEVVDARGHLAVLAEYTDRGRQVRVATVFALDGEVAAALGAVGRLLEERAPSARAVVDAYVWAEGPPGDTDALARRMGAEVSAAGLGRGVRRVVLAVTGPGRGLGMAASQHLTYWRHGADFHEMPVFRSLHPMMAERLRFRRLRHFTLRRLPSVEDVYLFHGVAHANTRDERLFAQAEVRDVTPVVDENGHIVGFPHFERMLLEALAAIRTWQSHRAPGERLQWNRVLLHVWPPLEVDARVIHEMAQRLAPETEGLGLEKIVIRARMRDGLGKLRDTTLDLTNPLGTGVVLARHDTPAHLPLQPLDEYRQKVVSMRRRGLVYPYEIVEMLTPPAGTEADIPPGDFSEHDLDAAGALVPVDRPYGRNTANLVVGVVRSFTWKHPEGMARVILLGDPSRSLGALAEAECRRIIAALDLAERMQVPVEWFTLSSGARIAMDSGTENMDWIALVLRRIIEFTQAGGEINLVVNGINVGAQPYWNAEATMLMHTRGILVMTPDGAMVLTGKQALDYSGGVSAEDNLGIGGFERVMGPNGQAQYWTPDLSAACRLLLRHYEHTYRAPGERFPRRAVTEDPFDRDAGDSPHPHGLGSEFSRVGDVFSEERNPGRKKPFDMRAVMGAVVDRDHAPLERWAGMRHAEVAVVWDAHLGGWPVCLLGMESRPLPRAGFIPADGPEQWTSGTLFPRSSKKLARAINAASDNRPLVVLANLSGFDGSPESMRRLQLEFGAEIGRAVVNFRGPLVFCVVARYHGGAFVVFSAALNDSMEVAALEGSYASVIGGAPAAAVVFARDVDARTRSDPRVVEVAAEVAAAAGSEKAALRSRMAALLEQVRSEKLGEVAAEFDDVHTVQRAQRVGSVHRIIPAVTLRPYLIDAVERGIARELGAAGR